MHALDSLSRQLILVKEDGIRSLQFLGRKHENSVDSAASCCLGYSTWEHSRAEVEPSYLIIILFGHGALVGESQRSRWSWDLQDPIRKEVRPWVTERKASSRQGISKEVGAMEVDCVSLTSSARCDHRRCCIKKARGKREREGQDGISSPDSRTGDCKLR